jgi:hypothetical protein
MDKSILIPSALLAALVIGLYLFRCWKHSHEVNNAVLINSIFYSNGIVCGVALVLSPFFPEIKNILGGMEIYILIGGVAVLFVSTQSIHRDAIRATRESAANKPSKKDAQTARASS